MAKEKKKEAPKFKNVAVLLDDHAMLHELATADQRSMARQLSVLIKKSYEEARRTGTV
jgi:hypothetical protein